MLNHMLFNMLYNITDIYENWYFTSPAVGCLNNDRTVMSLPYAWRILACLPILKGSACTNTSNLKDWQAQRSMALYHSAMAHIIPELNDICAKDNYYRFADKLVRQGRWFWHLRGLLPRGAWCSVQLISMSTSATATVGPGRGPQMGNETWCYITCCKTCYIAMYITYAYITCYITHCIASQYNKTI